jgi:hypothetical protein
MITVLAFLLVAEWVPTARSPGTGMAACSQPNGDTKCFSQGPGVRIYTAPALVADLNRHTRASLSRSPNPASPPTANPKVTAILKAKPGIKTALRHIPDGDCT